MDEDRFLDDFHWARNSFRRRHDHGSEIIHFALQYDPQSFHLT